MPVGTIFLHQSLKTLFIKGEDGRYYQPKPETELPPETKVSYEVLEVTGAPPGFYFAQNVFKFVEPTQPPKTQGVWGKPLPTTISNPTPPTVTKTVSTPKIKTIVSAPAIVVPKFAPLTERQTIEDFEAICNKVDNYDFQRNKGFGGSLQVKTPLKWEGEGKKLYLRVKDKYHDVRISGQGLWYFVGTMGLNFGKGGFRISGHTRDTSRIKNSETYGVLHIEN